MSTAFWREFWSNPARRSQPFVSNSGSDHRAEDIAASGGNLTVPALRGGRVAAHGQQSQVGYWFSIDVGGGRFDVYCHVFVGRRPAVGAVVGIGDEITRMATFGEVTGSAWTGPHIHFVVSDHEAGATRNYNAFDPRPIIAATLAASPSTPTPEPEEDLPVNVQLVLYVPRNTLILVDHLNKTMRDLGNSASDPARAYFASKPYTRAVDRGTTVPAGAVVWQDLIRVSSSNPNGEYRYL